MSDRKIQNKSIARERAPTRSVGLSRECGA
jgi:hypothetical protein